MLTVIFCSFCAWMLPVLFFVSVFVTLNKGVAYVKRLHQIPCAGCDFFTNDYRLKCTVRPSIACSEEAIGCRDFEPKTSACNACQKYAGSDVIRKFKA
ncbi:hypothetical protein [Argonema antarcticum]|uniref:hypothetical protein n=1 Tax=Argonema antarcticum TaxID=2942763 RepID=UPI002013471D|nr:hypothetical protein [Argonema antarcticum]MCL1469881.1 hypothetical protein [Argonema antarcticum A004/B2]